MYEVVRIVELDPIPVSTGSDSLCLRIEIRKELGRVDRYRARLLRWDTYRIAPSFGNGGNSSSADEEILVADPLWDSQSAAAPTAREALALVLSRLRDQLPRADIPDLDSIDD